MKTVRRFLIIAALLCTALGVTLLAACNKDECIDYTITVTCDESDVLSAVKVKLISPSNATTEPQALDDEHRAVFHLAPAVYLVELEGADGYAYPETTVDSLIPRATVALTEVVATRTLSLAVNFPDGTAATGLEVKLISEDGDAFSMTTGSTGVAKFTKLPLLPFAVHIDTAQENFPAGFDFDDAQYTVNATATSKTVYLLLCLPNQLNGTWVSKSPGCRLTISGTDFTFNAILMTVNGTIISFHEGTGAFTCTIPQGRLEGKYDAQAGTITINYPLLGTLVFVRTPNEDDGGDDNGNKDGDFILPDLNGTWVEKIAGYMLVVEGKKFTLSARGMAVNGTVTGYDELTGKISFTSDQGSYEALYSETADTITVEYSKLGTLCFERLIDNGMQLPESLNGTWVSEIELGLMGTYHCYAEIHDCIITLSIPEMSGSYACTITGYDEASGTLTLETEQGNFEAIYRDGATPSIIVYNPGVMIPNLPISLPSSITFYKWNG